MSGENKKMLISVGVIAIIAFAIIGLINLKKSESQKKLIKDSEKMVEQSKKDVFNQEIIDNMSKLTDVKEQIKKVDDMNEKLGFVPAIPEVLSDGLTACAVTYIDENDFCINEKLENVPKEDVKGIEYLFEKTDMKIGSSIKLRCKKMTEEQFAEHSKRFQPENVKTAEHSNKNIYYINKLVRYVKLKTYDEIVNSPDYVPTDKYEIVRDLENDNELAKTISCEWYDNGICYELIGKYMEDTELMVNYAKEIIDYMA